MTRTSEELFAELRHPRFRWFRRAGYGLYLVMALLAIRVVALVTRTNIPVVPPVSVQIAWGACLSLWGALAVCCPRTGREYLRLLAAFQVTELEAAGTPERELRWLEGFYRFYAAVAPLTLLVGLWVLIGGLAKLF